MEGVPDNARRYLGFYTYDDAHQAWNNFERNGSLPVGISTISPNMKRIAETCGDNMRSTIKAQEAAIARLPPAGSPTGGPNMHSAVVLTLPSQFESMHVATPRRRSQRQAAAASPQYVAPSPLEFQPTPLPLPGLGAQFWVVFKGPNPGVYRDQ